MPLVATWMDLESERERQILYDITYMQNLKYDTNEVIFQTRRLIDIENTLVVAKEEGGRGGLGVLD